MFWKILVIQHYTCWIYLDLDLHLVYFIMQNYPVTREWNEDDWLVPLLQNPFISLTYNICPAMSMNSSTWSYRIVGQDCQNRHVKQDMQDKQDSDAPVVPRPVTFLQHGLVGSSADWCIGNNRLFYFKILFFIFYIKIWFCLFPHINQQLLQFTCKQLT